MGGGDIAVVQFLRHSLHNDLLQTTGDVGVDGAGQSRAAVDVFNGNRHGRIAVIGRSSGHHFIHHNAQGVDVGTGIHSAALCLFGRDVVDRAQGFFCKGISLGHHPGDTEISYLYRAVFQHHNVVGLNVPVDDAPAVGVFQRLCDLHSKVQGLLPVENALLFHVLFQADAVDQLHNDVICLQGHGGGHVVNRNDVGMAEHSDRLAFRVETAAEILVLQIVILQYLDSHKTVESVAACFIYNRHAAGADHFQDLIPVIQQASNILIHFYSSFPSFLNAYQNAGNVIGRAPFVCYVHKALAALCPVLVAGDLKEHLLLIHQIGKTVRAKQQAVALL